METLFDVKHATISEHIKNIFKEGELDEKTSVGISDKSSGGRKSKIYNLDIIISVGYRVKSKNGVIFRKWANKILKDYMLKGYALNQKRLEYLEKTIKLIDIANRIDEKLEGNDAKEILKIIGEYSKALDLLDDYQKIGVIYDFVRNDILFGYNRSDLLTAEEVLNDEYGQCNTKNKHYFYHGAIITERNVPLSVSLGMFVFTTTNPMKVKRTKKC